MLCIKPSIAPYYMQGQKRKIMALPNVQNGERMVKGINQKKDTSIPCVEMDKDVDNDHNSKLLAEQ